MEKVSLKEIYREEYENLLVQNYYTGENVDRLILSEVIKYYKKEKNKLTEEKYTTLNFIEDVFGDSDYVHENTVSYWINKKRYPRKVILKKMKENNEFLAVFNMIEKNIKETALNEFDATKEEKDFCFFDYELELETSLKESILNGEKKLTEYENELKKEDPKITKVFINEDKIYAKMNKPNLVKDKFEWQLLNEKKIDGLRLIRLQKLLRRLGVDKSSSQKINLTKGKQNQGIGEELAIHEKILDLLNTSPSLLFPLITLMTDLNTLHSESKELNESYEAELDRIVLQLKNSLIGMKNDKEDSKL
ncbi:hypothetical protein [Oceanobacillus sp. J11TS1]|uniref:hypothetical protein n=1 Tax=Oceanobacillus sp. J11TS1 TaxID=2807191 RepID=UPI001B0B05DF|nr:hypothetical protein [Oceanobacillus sp. J11TS1]GIO22512.1 hypothetical protein J11TS1_10930 [Oceanobacillus sp. J11TS1]